MSSNVTNNYRVEQKPFFGYSGSIYLSFLIKAHEDLEARKLIGPAILIPNE